MLNIAFCDDDNIFLHMVELKVKKIFETLKVHVVIDLFTDANVLINKLEQYEMFYHIIFLDIEMPEIDGKEVARKLRLINHDFKLIFITSYEQEVLNIFQYDVSGFIPKMSLDERMLPTLEYVMKDIDTKNPQIQVFKVKISENKCTTVKIPLIDIIYIESINKKNFLHTKKATYLLHGYKFTEIVEYYKKFDFIDIHRTCIVNLKYIYSIDDIEVHLDDETILPLSRRKRQYVLDRFILNICEVTKCSS